VIRHLVQTRFAIKVAKMDGVVVSQSGAKEPLSPEWVAKRFELFERYLLPSMQAQTFADFTWLMYVHPEFEQEHVERLRGYDVRIRVVTDPVTPIRGIGGIVASTRIDSDDGFASDALEVVQSYAERFAAGRQPAQLLRLQNGWWNDHAQSRVYQWRGWSFLTVMERAAPYRGALAMSCDDIGKAYPEWVYAPPCWLRVVHDGNVRNRLDPKHPTIPLADLRDRGFAWLGDEPAPDSEPELTVTVDEPVLVPVEPTEPPPEPVLPRVTLLMETTDRRRSLRRAQTNYVKGTVTQLVQQGVTGLRLQLSKVHDTAWIQQELGPDLLAKVQIQPTAVDLSRNATAIAALASVDLESTDWVLLLEDDLRFCKDFVPSVQRWLQAYGRPDRHLFRFWGFHGFRAPTKRMVSAFDHPIDAKMSAAQAIAWRSVDARDFVQWAHVHLPSWRGYGPGKPNPGIAFDKFVAAWAIARWPGVPGVLSWPFFVDHIGAQSSIHTYGGMNHAGFAGTSWSFTGPSSTAVAGHVQTMPMTRPPNMRRPIPHRPPVRRPSIRPVTRRAS
jgi:hypothetical protein